MLLLLIFSLLLVILFEVLRTGRLLVQECTLVHLLYLILEHNLGLLEQVPLNLLNFHVDASSLVLLADQLDETFELNASVTPAFGG